MTGGGVLAARISGMQDQANRHCVVLGRKPGRGYQWVDRSVLSEFSVRCLICPIKNVHDSFLKYPELLLRAPFLQISNQVQERCRFYSQLKLAYPALDKMCCPRQTFSQCWTVTVFQALGKPEFYSDIFKRLDFVVLDEDPQVPWSQQQWKPWPSLGQKEQGRKQCFWDPVKALAMKLSVKQLQPETGREMGVKVNTLTPRSSPLLPSLICWYFCSQIHLESSGKGSCVMQSLCVCVPSHFSRVQFFCDPMDCSPPSSSFPGVFQVRILEGVGMPSSRGSSQSRDWARVSCSPCTADGFFTTEPPGKL